MSNNIYWELIFSRQRYSNIKCAAANRGIYFDITYDEMAHIWNRDYLGGHMQTPSMDRICVSYGYTYWNLRLIEGAENTRRNGRGMSRKHSDKESKSVVIRVGRGYYNSVKRLAENQGRSLKKTLELVITDGIQLPLEIKALREAK